MSGMTVTVIPQTGSIAVRGGATATRPARLTAPARPRRPGPRPGPAAERARLEPAGTGRERRVGRRARTDCDDLGQDRQRDLRRRAGADVEPGRGVDPGPLAPASARARRARPRRAAGWRPARCTATPAVERGPDRGRPRPGRGWRPRPRPRAPGSRRPAATAPSRSRASRRSRRARSATGVSPTTSISGAGSIGCRKISRAPPDRQVLTTTCAPGESGNGALSSGSTRSSTVSPSRSAPSAAVRTERLGALPADEPLDRAVRQHDRVVAGLGRGRHLGADHRRVHERHSLGGQLQHPGRHPRLIGTSSPSWTIARFRSDRRLVRCPASPPTPATG